MSVSCETICDGVAVPYITDEMFPLLCRLADRVALISEADVEATIRTLVGHNKIVVEGSGALAVAAALATPVSERGRSVAIVSGGSIDASKLARILAQGD